MNKLLFFPIVLLLINCTSLYPRSPASVKPVTIHAHRGSANYPENMMTAFQHAVTLGADVLEMDLQITKDDKIVVAHDAYLRDECTTRKGIAVTPKTIFFRNLKLSEVEDWDCGTKTTGKITPVPGEGVSSLEHVLEAFRRVNAKSGKPIAFNIEIKYNPSQPQLYPLRAFYVKHVMAVIKDSGVDEARLMIQSFDVGILEEVRKLYPTLRLVPLIGDAHAMNRAAGYVRDLKTDFVSPHHALVTKKVVESFHKMGVQVVPWTVNDEKTKKKMQEAGVDGIITDTVELYKK